MDIKNYRGLNADQATQSRARYGSNAMSRKKKRSFISSYISNLGDPVVRVLIISLAVNIIFTFRSVDWIETGGIAVAILLSTVISTLSERSSDRAFERLSKEAKSLCTVLRGGRAERVSADSVAVGDVIILGAGDKIAADGILIRGSVALDQSAMTGESRETQKSVFSGNFTSFDGVDEKWLSPDAESSCLAGCFVSSGEGEMLVCRVGDRTYLGGIVGELQAQVRESPLKLRLTKLAKQISLLGYGAAALIALVSLFSAIFVESGFVREIILSRLTDPRFMAEQLLHSLTLGLTVVIMAVPEGLPMMIAVVLSSNVKRMLSDNVLIRKQTGIEAAGSMNILFTDKTGTLTRGRMSVCAFILPDGSRVDSLAAFKKGHPALFRSFCENALLNTGAREGRCREIIGGNATERALFEAARGHIRADVGTVISALPFESENKYSSATTYEKTYFKGAPEKLLDGALQSDRLAVEYAILLAQGEGKRVIAGSRGENGVHLRRGAIRSAKARGKSLGGRAERRGDRRGDGNGRRLIDG